MTADGVAIVRGDPRLLDVQLVDTLGTDGISYTPDADEALRRVREGEAATAYLMRPTRIEDVFAAARRGEVLPQKTTYFYPKLISGLSCSRCESRGSRPAATAAAASGRCWSSCRRGSSGSRSSGRRGRRRHDGDRRGRRGGGRRAARAARRGLHARLRGARRGDVRLGRPVARRARPDRRLAEREAGHPVLLALARRRGRAGDARRRLRLRLRLRHAARSGRRRAAAARS